MAAVSRVLPSPTAPKAVTSATYAAEARSDEQQMSSAVARSGARESGIARCCVHFFPLIFLIFLNFFPGAPGAGKMPYP